MSKIRVIIVDDHDVVRWGLLAFFEISEELELVGEANSGAEALRLCNELQPDVVLMDVVMPGMSGVEATRLISEKHPHIQVVALSSVKDYSNIRNMLEAGAVGYVLKDASIQDLTHTIQSAYAGNTVFSTEVTQVLFQKKQDYELTKREHEVLKLMIKGLSNREIGLALDVSLSTAKFHVSSIISKLGVNNRVEAVAMAIERNLVT